MLTPLGYLPWGAKCPFAVALGQGSPAALRGGLGRALGPGPCAGPYLSSSTCRLMPAGWDPNPNLEVIKFLSNSLKIMTIGPVPELYKGSYLA